MVQPERSTVHEDLKHHLTDSTGTTRRRKDPNHGETNPSLQHAGIHVTGQPNSIKHVLANSEPFLTALQLRREINPKNTS